VFGVLYFVFCMQIACLEPTSEILALTSHSF
jgi:prevent-host-death family protein